ncbi:MAG: TldD/PmbA family protein [Chloroflexota bacterium]|nr:MAG: TldD/PmbA family protein [Chloroflexota bacterium]
MLGYEKLKQLADTALTHSKADQTEIVLQTVDSSLSRFANNTIHQNVFESNATARVRVILGKRTGVAASNDLSAEGIARTVKMARAIAQAQTESPANAPLPESAPAPRVDAFVQRTADCSPETRAHLISRLCKQAASQKLIAAGAFRTDAYEIAVANSLGAFQFHQGTVADLHTVVMNEAGTASGYASASSPDVRAVDGDAVTRTAIDKALRSQNPIALAPGEYTVILEPAAVAMMLQYLAWHTFNALAVQEERSFVRGKRGELLFSPLVNLYDDGAALDGFPSPFDHEGVPRQRVAMIENGVARDVVYDTFTARRDNVQSTGHSLPAPNVQGPLARNLFLAAGDKALAEMIGSVQRGILITRFWYTRVVAPLNVMMTGLTRDGTFLIENGQLSLPVKNLRFTTSYIEALKNIGAVGRDTQLVRDEWFGMNFRAPAVMVERFNFTGVT